VDHDDSAGVSIFNSKSQWPVCFKGMDDGRWSFLEGLASLVREDVMTLLH
jgi:hypothetical protein